MMRCNGAARMDHGLALYGCGTDISNGVMVL